MLNPQTQTIVTELRMRLTALYGDRLVRLVLYGSQARGDAETESDIDVLVVLKEPVSAPKEIARTSELKAEICLKHDVVVSCVYVSETRYENEQSPLLMNVRREGIPL